MDMKELFKKHGKAMLKQKDCLNIFDGFEMIRPYAVFPTAGPHEMYMIAAKKSAAFPADSNQKYRHIISKLGDQLKKMPTEMEQKILGTIFDTYTKMELIKHTKAEVEFYKNDIVLSTQFVDNDVYHLKTKTSGKSYHNKPMRVFKYFYINEGEFTVVNSIVQEIQRHTFTVAYHLKGDKIVVFTTDPHAKVKTVLKDEFDTIEEASEFIRVYFEKIIFHFCWRKDLQGFFSNNEYEYDSFEHNHLALYFAYIIQQALFLFGSVGFSTFNGKNIFHLGFK